MQIWSGNPHSLLKCGRSSNLHWTQSSTVRPESVPASHPPPPPTAEEGDSLAALPFWEGHVCLWAHFLTAWRSDQGHGLHAYTCKYTYPYEYVYVCHSLVCFMKHTICVLVGFWSNISLEWPYWSRLPNHRCSPASKWLGGIISAGT